MTSGWMSLSGPSSRALAKPPRLKVALLGSAWRDVAMKSLCLCEHGGCPVAPNSVFRSQSVLWLPFSHGHAQFHPSLVLPLWFINFPPFHQLVYRLCLSLSDSGERDGPHSPSRTGRVDHVEQPVTLGRGPRPVPWASSPASPAGAVGTASQFPLGRHGGLGRPHDFLQWRWLHSAILMKRFSRF